MDNTKLESNIVEEPVFLDDDGPSADVPPYVSAINIRELFGWQPGETLKEVVVGNSK